MVHISVHFRILLKRGQKSSAKIQGGEPHIKYNESQFLRGGGKSTPWPPPPPK